MHAGCMGEKKVQQAGFDTTLLKQEPMVYTTTLREAVFGNTCPAPDRLGLGLGNFCLLVRQIWA